ncbi:MAG TPA: HEAT repeat domain-containing protein [Planctomycetota bacterium]|nr:HEAT repeat domain-containing protein [Planctomycetota bacterium]
MNTRPLATSRILVIAVAAVFATATASAQYGYYYGPDTAASVRASPGTGAGGSGGGGGANRPRLGGQQSSSWGNADVDASHWETWWALNREEFLPHRGLRQERTPYPVPGSPVTSDDVRKRIIPALVRALKSRDQDVRAAAAIALGKTGEATEVEALRALLEDRDRTVVEAAIVGLGLLRRPEAESLLAKIVNDDDRAVRERPIAAVMLGVSGGDWARKALFERLGGEKTDRSASGRSAAQLDAARALGAAL